MIFGAENDFLLPFTKFTPQTYPQALWSCMQIRAQVIVVSMTRCCWSAADMGLTLCVMPDPVLQGGGQTKNDVVLFKAHVV